MRTTHTYAIVEIPQEAFTRIRLQLEAAGYGEQIHWDEGEPGRPVIDMHGLAIQAEVQTPAAVRASDMPIAPGADPAGDALAVLHDVIPDGTTTMPIGGLLCACKWPVPSGGMVLVHVCKKCHLPIVPKENS